MAPTSTSTGRSRSRSPTGTSRTRASPGSAPRTTACSSSSWSSPEPDKERAMQYLVHAGHFGHRFGHDGGRWWLGGLLGLLLFAAIVTLAVLLGMRLAGRPRHWGGPHMG